MRALSPGLLLLAGIAVGGVSCSSDPCAFGECAATGDGGVGSGEGGIAVPPGCDLAKPLKESAPCIDDAVGVFVAPTGDDAAAGAKAKPVRSIGKGLELAAARKVPRVYVCEGTYDAAVEIKAPVAVFGGLTCAWAAAETARPRIAPPKGIAVRVTKVSGAVVVEDVDVVGSADANVPGDSAIGVFVAESTGVVLRRVKVGAGGGTAGGKGATATNYAGATATKGGAASGGIAGTGASCTCTDGSTSKGGDGAAGNGTAVSSGTSVPAVGGSNSGLSGQTNCTDGQTGASGANGAAGTSSTSAGTLSANGWDSKANGANGKNGSPGQGGGGGGAKTDGNAAGGGGACGGCGGGGGGSGTNGGASLGLVSFNATVVIEGGALTTASGGSAGAGGEGQDGQAGGTVSVGACNGGPGGHGAGGSGGGGGAGGHSVPIIFAGTEPRVTGATLTPGTKGAGGAGGNPGAGPGNAGNAGVAGPEGKSQNTLAL